MLWSKKKYLVEIKGGEGSKNTLAMHGLIQHLIVIPPEERAEWSLQLIDRDNDVILDLRDQFGRLDCFDLIPIGADRQQVLTIKVWDVTQNGTMTVIFKVREGK